MKKPLLVLRTMGSVDGSQQFKRIKIENNGITKLPMEPADKTGGLETTEALCIQLEDGFKIVPLLPDVKKVYLEITTKCNLACTTCIRNSWEDSLNHMEWPVFQAVLEQLKGLPDLKTVHFGGFGEPLSHPRIMEMVAAVKGLGLQAELITNGLLLSEEVAGRLVELGLDRLYISMDGPDAEEYNEIRVGSDFGAVVANIQGLNRQKQARRVEYPTLGIEFVAMRKNYHKLPKLVRLANELKVDTILVTNVLPYNEEMKDEILYDRDDTKISFGAESMWVLIKAQLPHMKLRTERYCKFIEDKALSVSQEGYVSPCNALLHSYQCYIYGRVKKMKPYRLGNVMEKSLREIWTDAGYAHFRSTVKDFRFPSCTDCRYLDGCSYVDDNEMDCWGNSPSCSECLWARGMIICP
ncbi:MAG: tungsten cofactor oxidoreductase radical SAM maturase [Clostridia bacterium]|nr:tungsten cofactor oxidoreductase radical SAM maturase [Clostridia bacterium]